MDVNEIYSESHIRVEQSHSTNERASIIECLQEYATTKPDDEAFVFASNNEPRESLTWLQLYQRSCATARSLIHLGIKRDEIVAINLRTCPEWLYATFGAMLAGVIPVSLSFTYTDGSDLIAAMEKLNRCSILILDPGVDDINWNILEGLLDAFDKDGSVRSKRMPNLRYLVGHRFEQSKLPVKSFKSFLDDLHPDTILPTVDTEDVAIMLQTSGSTGVPKFVVHTHASLTAIRCSDLKYIDSTYVLFNDRPFTWVGGFPLSVLTGQKRVTISGFCDVSKTAVSFIIGLIVKERCSLVLVLPPLMTELMRRQEELPAEWPVDVIMSGGQPLTKSLVTGIGKVCKCFCSLYAGTEVFGLTQQWVQDPERFTEYGCGKAVLMKGFELKVVDEKENTVPTNTKGEILVKSPAMFKEYFHDPVKTKEVKSDDDWFKTDDIGRMTEYGEFFVEGRKSNIIISGGMTVSPEILETVMKSFPGVASVAIVPVPDSVLFQVLCACVIKKPGEDVTMEKLRQCCENFHADKPKLFTVLPTFYIFIDSFPLLSSGKINRIELKRIALTKCS